MILHVTTAEYLHGYTLAVSFNNGQKGIADLTDALGQGLGCRRQPALGDSKLGREPDELGGNAVGFQGAVQPDHHRLVAVAVAQECAVSRRQVTVRRAR